MSEFNNDEKTALEKLQEIYDRFSISLKNNSVKIRIKKISSKKGTIKVTEILYSKNSKTNDSIIPELPSLAETPELKDASEEDREIVQIYLEENNLEANGKKPWFEPKNLLYPILGGFIVNLILNYRGNLSHFLGWIIDYLKSFI
ncbi:MAG: hypothetical protein AAGA80_25845 [Cyanobacteria bacterium P01_F01_bin.143]